MCTGAPRFFASALRNEHDTSKYTPKPNLIFTLIPLYLIRMATDSFSCTLYNLVSNVIYQKRSIESLLEAWISTRSWLILFCRLVVMVVHGQTLFLFLYPSLSLWTLFLNISWTSYPEVVKRANAVCYLASVIWSPRLGTWTTYCSLYTLLLFNRQFVGTVHQRLGRLPLLFSFANDTFLLFLIFLQNLPLISFWFCVLFYATDHGRSC